MGYQVSNPLLTCKHVLKTSKCFHLWQHGSRVFSTFKLYLWGHIFKLNVQCFKLKLRTRENIFARQVAKIDGAFLSLKNIDLIFFHVKEWKMNRQKPFQVTSNNPVFFFPSVHQNPTKNKNVLSLLFFCSCTELLFFSQVLRNPSQDCQQFSMGLFLC